jgi:hypothetical protein
MGSKLSKSGPYMEIWFPKNLQNSDERMQIRIKFEKGRDEPGNPQLDGTGKPLYEVRTQVCDVSKLQSCSVSRSSS